MKTQKHQKMEPRVNAAAWRTVKCPVCHALTNETCVNVNVKPGKPRKAHFTRIELARERVKRVKKVRSGLSRPKRTKVHVRKPRARSSNIVYMRRHTE